MGSHADLPAHLHEQPVESDPVLARKDAFEGEQGLSWRGSGEAASSMRDPVGVNGDADEGLAAGNAQSRVRALRPSSRKRQ